MIVLFSHQKGGVGKSTIAINLAYAARKHFDEVKILDLDSQNSAKLFNDLRESEDRETVYCLTENDFNIIEEFKNKPGTLLVIDSGGYDSNINRAALIAADIIITPCSISQIELFGLQKFRDMLEAAGDATGLNFKTNVLLNNVDSRSKAKLEELKDYIKSNKKHFNLLDTVIYARADFKSSYGEGLTVKEHNKKGEAAAEIKAFTKEIIKLINNS